MSRLGFDLAAEIARLPSGQQQSTEYRLKARGATLAPTADAIAAAATSACCAAIPPCLTVKLVMSPAA